MRRPLPFLVLTLFVGLLAGCSGLKGADEAPLPLSPGEQATVREKLDLMLDGSDRKHWGAAWDQEIQAGAERARLTRIALGALGADDSDASEMFASLVAKWGPLEEGDRAQVNTRVHEAEGRKDFARAMEIELITADDAPAYARAWALYQRSPTREGADLLDAIQDARKEHAKEQD